MNPWIVTTAFVAVGCYFGFNALAELPCCYRTYQMYRDDTAIAAGMESVTASLFITLVGGLFLVFSSNGLTRPIVRLRKV